MRVFASLSVTLFAALLLAACGGSDPAAQAPPVQPGPGTDIDFGALPADSFPLTLENNTRGVKGDDEIFITITAFNHQSSGDLIYVKPSGRQVIGAIDDKNTQGVVGIEGVATLAKASDNHCDPATKACHVNYSFTLADLGSSRTLVIPGHSGPDSKGSTDTGYHGARIWVSMGRPLLQQVSCDGTGACNISQPDVIGNRNDPNYLTVFDWFEFAYQPRASVPFGGNVTQVDFYSIPMSFTVTGVKTKAMERGITLGADKPGGVATSSSRVATRDELFKRYDEFVSSPFKGLVQQDDSGAKLRLIAPYYGANFQAGGPDEHYFDRYVDFVWATYANATTPLDFYDQPNRIGNRFHGCQPSQMQTGKLCFMYSSADTKVNSGPWYIAKPTTVHVFQNAGELQPGCQSSSTYNECNAFGAQLAAALNRGIAHDSVHWLSPDSFYKSLPKNDWAQFWHSVSVDGLAYGMGFDDTANQSSVAILPGDDSLKSVVIGIGW